MSDEKTPLLENTSDEEGWRQDDSMWVMRDPSARVLSDGEGLVEGKGRAGDKKTPPLENTSDGGVGQ